MNSWFDKDIHQNVGCKKVVVFAAERNQNLCVVRSTSVRGASPNFLRISSPASAVSHIPPLYSFKPYFMRYTQNIPSLTFKLQKNCRAKQRNHWDTQAGICVLIRWPARISVGSLYGCRDETQIDRSPQAGAFRSY